MYNSNTNFYYVKERLPITITITRSFVSAIKYDNTSFVAV